jgi:hypothetical protein
MEKELLYRTRVVAESGEDAAKDADEDGDDEADQAVQVVRGGIEDSLPVTEEKG